MTDDTDAPVETGLLDPIVMDGMVYEVTAKPSVATSVTVAVNPPMVELPDLSPSDLAALARQIARNINGLEAVLKANNITLEQFEALKTNIPFFKHALDTLTIEWNSVRSTPERIQLEAAATLEDSMLAIGARMVDKHEALPAVVEAGKFFAKLAGIGEQDKGGNAAGEKFTITINLGADTKLKYDIDTTPGPAKGGTAPLLENPQGERNPAPLRGVPERD